jgi:hypothetical protein
MLDPHPEMLKTGNHIIKKTARGFFSSLLEQIAFERVPRGVLNRD